MVVVEGPDTGNTVPLDDPIVATPGALLAQVPPPTASVNVLVVPRQTFVDPAIAGGVALTVIIRVTKQVVANV